MKPKKYGGPHFLRSRIVRRHLFFNERKSLSLDEMKEYGDGRFDRWFEVHKITVAEDAFRIERELVLATPVYSVAWDLVKDPDHEQRRRK